MNLEILSGKIFLLIINVVWYKSTMVRYKKIIGNRLYAKRGSNRLSEIKLRALCIK